MTLPALTLCINLILLGQFAHLTVISGLRIRHGQNGLTPFLLLVSASLTALVAIDMAYQVTVLWGVMGNPAVMAPLSGIELVVRTVLMVANIVYFVAIRREALAPLRKMTRAREKLYRAMEE